MPEAFRWQLKITKMKTSLKAKLQSLSKEEMKSYVGGKTITYYDKHTSQRTSATAGTNAEQFNYYELTEPSPIFKRIDVSK